MGEIHEFMMLAFDHGVGEAEQLQTMQALDVHLSQCPGLLARESFRDSDGRWLEHTVWASQEDLEASNRLEEDPALADLFERFDPGSVSYLRGKRIEPRAVVEPEPATT
jgi:hypothetical protein